MLQLFSVFLLGSLRLVTDGTWGLQAPDPARLGTTQQRLPSKTRQVELKNAGSYVGNANYINYIKIYICTYVCIQTDIFESDQPHGIVSKLSKDVLLQIADMDVTPFTSIEKPAFLNRFPR